MCAGVETYKIVYYVATQVLYLCICHIQYGVHKLKLDTDT